MESLSAAVGLFNNCLHAYRAVSGAIDIGNESLSWDILMRIELTRFEVWGRFLGFLDERTGLERATDDILELADILQIESARFVVRDTLLALKGTLEEFKQAAEKYRVGTKARREARRGNNLGSHWKRAVVSTKDLSLHILLVVKDKDKFKSLLKKLTDFNDGLEKLLSVAQRIQSGKALASNVLTNYNDATSLKLVGAVVGETSSETAIRNGREQQHYCALVATANVKRMSIVASGDSSGYTVERFELSVQSILELEPRFEKIEDKHSWSFTRARYRTETGESVAVLIEWRSGNALSSSSKITPIALETRRNQIVALLNAFSNASNIVSYHNLDCIGWFPFTGHINLEDSANAFEPDRIGFASKFPTWAESEIPPTTLRSLLVQAFEAQKPKIPSLGTRIQIARTLARSIYQLQCSQWLHRTLSSQQVVFFHDKKSIKLCLERPFLIGYQYSRPDDQFLESCDKKEMGYSEGRPLLRRYLGSLQPYLHPNLWGSNSRRYRRSDDIYSLGIILLEVALWEPINIYVQPSEFSEYDIDNSDVVKAAKTELPAQVGDIYKQVVLGCLQGLIPKPARGEKEWRGPQEVEFENSSKADAIPYDGVYRGEDDESGLESHLLWKVVRPLENIAI